MEQGFQGKKVVVYGIGKSGVAAARLLIRAGARVSAVDDRPEEELGDAPAALRSQGVTLRLGPRPKGLLNSADLVVVSPGVPLALP
ncbi:MAG TPA: UDP-N-acetylmuramoyl-L-alanine--D-glutamate ligase, partial [Myxococcaceae bacterium]|nr:UDP-N-acetylmuramoyl-L-alanine--D-glutamate ligase [Myxococcaceae bacterium]